MSTDSIPTSSFKNCPISRYEKPFCIITTYYVKNNQKFILNWLAIQSKSTNIFQHKYCFHISSFWNKNVRNWIRFYLKYKYIVLNTFRRKQQKVQSVFHARRFLQLANQSELNMLIYGTFLVRKECIFHKTFQSNVEN